MPVKALLALSALAAVALILLIPGDALAQSQTTLVSNAGKTADDSLTPNRAAQAFTVGAASAALGSITLVGGGFCSTCGNTVTLHQTSRTGTKVADFTAAIASAGAGTNNRLVLTPTTDVTLAASTTYVIVTANDFGSSDSTTWWATASPDEDAVKADDWSIADGSEFYRTTTMNWVTSTTSRMITVSPPAAQAAAAVPSITVPNAYRVPAVLTAGKGNIADSDGLPAESAFTWQWVRVSGATETNIANATGKTYTLTDADAGKRIRVRASFTDNASNAETRTSAPTPFITARATCNAPAYPSRYAQIWTGTLTLGQGLTEGNAAYGFRRLLTGEPATASVFGELSNRTFTVEGMQYTIVRMFSGGFPARFAFRLDTSAHIPLSLQAQLRLYVCDREFLLSDSRGRRGSYSFFSDIPDWSGHAERTLYLAYPTPYIRTPTADFDGITVWSGSTPVGISSNGRTMWVLLDEEHDKIYGYRMSDKRRDSSEDFDIHTLSGSTNNDPRGIFARQSSVWVVDGVDDQLYGYRDLPSTLPVGDSTTPLTRRWTYLDSGLTAANNDPTGIWSGRVPRNQWPGLGGLVRWVADSDDDKLYSYQFIGGETYLCGNTSCAHPPTWPRRWMAPYMDFNTLAATGNNDPGGIWSDGYTMWVLDTVDDKIYAYWMSDKGRDPDRDFDTLKGAGNDDPAGIWSDGETMWVLDSADKKIYSYSMPRPDITPPSVVSAAVNGTSLVITFNEELGTRTFWPLHPVRLFNTPFTVTKVPSGSPPGTARAVAVALTGSPSISGKTLTLTLAAPVTPGDTSIEVSYTMPTSCEPSFYPYTTYCNNKLMDRDANLLARISVQSVTNNTPASQAPNSPAEGAPAVSGTARAGETLTATTAAITDVDGLEQVTFGYQWLADGADIDGATGATYTLNDADAGKVVSVRVSFTDDAGNEESLTSASTSPVAAALGLEAESAALDGATLTLEYNATLDDGVTLPVSAFSVSANGASRSVNSVSVSGSAVTLTLASPVSPGDAVTVSYTRPAGPDFIRDTQGRAADSFSGLSVTNNTRAASLTAGTHGAPASHDGSAAFTFELRFSETPADGFSYRTLRDHAFTVTGGEVTKAHRLEEGKNLRWEITVEPSGNADVTVTLPATTDCDDEGAVCTGDGRMLSTPVTLTVPGPDSQDRTPNTPATGAPAIEGTARVGETLTAATTGISDADGVTNATFSYQWLADDAEISGATGSTYTLVAGDKGKAIKVRVSFTDDAGNEESLTSAATGAVAARPNRPATGAPTISGTAQVSQTLTADTSGIKDADGLTNASYSYQWVRNDGNSDADIQGAASASYTLVAADEGKTVKVRVSFTDDRGHQETLTSAATGTISDAPSPLTASIHTAPQSHDGSAAFTFELRLSEAPADGFSYKTLRDHAFTVTGGDVTKARRLEPGKNIRWEITVQQSGNGDVTLVLPSTSDCGNQGAICTGDGRMLSSQVSLTVSGPSG